MPHVIEVHGFRFEACAEGFPEELPAFRQALSRVKARLLLIKPEALRILHTSAIVPQDTEHVELACITYLNLLAAAAAGLSDGKFVVIRPLPPGR